MEDRDRIADLIGSEHYYEDDWEEIKTGNQPNVSPKNAQWVFDVADRIIRILPELGYTRQPEPLTDKVDAVAKYLYEEEHAPGYWDTRMSKGDKSKWLAKAREILKLFPEYEPVELELLWRMRQRDNYK